MRGCLSMLRMLYMCGVNFIETYIWEGVILRGYPWSLHFEARVIKLFVRPRAFQFIESKVNSLFYTVARKHTRSESIHKAFFRHSTTHYIFARACRVSLGMSTQQLYITQCHERISRHIVELFLQVWLENMVRYDVETHHSTTKEIQFLNLGNSLQLRKKNLPYP